MNTVVRTRFAPSPSGFLHLGNLRSALFSFLAARESHGVFILRIEDTDTTRTSDEYLNAIYYYLTWMGLLWDEGPHKGGSCGSYKQSERHEIYENYLKKCIDLGCVYRCFKTTEELDMERAKQIACGLPPRYVRVINDQKEQQYLQEGKPFVWRFALSQGTISITDKVRGKSTFDLSNFADAPITRQDGTFTFLFANFVDDIEMNNIDIDDIENLPLSNPNHSEDLQAILEDLYHCVIGKALYNSDSPISSFITLYTDSDHSSMSNFECLLNHVSLQMKV